MPTKTPSDPTITPDHLATTLEHHGDEILALVVAALRGDATTHTLTLPTPPPPSGHSGGAHAASQPPPAPPSPKWRKVSVINGFEHSWPEVHEHYGPMTVWEGRDARGPVWLAIGSPRERLPIYGSERGWVSVWEVVNGQPREQRAVFVETDNFATTGERIAIINGKNGNGKAGFAPGEQHLLPAIYHGMRVEVHRIRCNGPYARNRLGVVATDRDTEVMLNHALAHLRLRS